MADKPVKESTAGKRRLIVCDDETWQAFLAWGARHEIKGYHGRITVQATLTALLLASGDYEQ